MLSEQLHNVNEVMSPTYTRYSSGLSVSCLAPNLQSFPLLSPEQQQTLWLHALWSWLSWGRGVIGNVIPMGRQSGEEKALFSCLGQGFFGYGLLKVRDNGEKVGPFGGLWFGRARNSCQTLARKPSLGSGICPVSEIIK